MTSFEISRRDYIEARRDAEAAEKRHQQAQSRLKETRARLLDIVCNANESVAMPGVVRNSDLTNMIEPGALTV